MIYFVKNVYNFRHAMFVAKQGTGQKTVLRYREFSSLSY